MSLLSEIIIEPGKSKIYLRLILVIYLITATLILFSSIYLLIKLILLGFILKMLRIDWVNQSPCSSIKRIQFIGSKWILELPQGKNELYTQAVVLIHNPFFQLIEFVSARNKKRVVLFLDQITHHQLRLLHLKISQSGI